MNLSGRARFVALLALVAPVLAAEDVWTWQPADTIAGLQEPDPEVPILEVEIGVVAAQRAHETRPNEARLHDRVRVQQPLPRSRDPRRERTVTAVVPHDVHVRRQHIELGMARQPG